MSEIDKVTGDIEISERGWTITLDSLKKGNERQLEKDIVFIRKVNPASGLTFSRHINVKGASGASGCDPYLNNPNQLAKCLISKKKSGLL